MPIISEEGGIMMERYFEEKPEIKAAFDKLPQSVRNMIVESGVKIDSLDELKKTADAIMKAD